MWGPGGLERWEPTVCRAFATALRDLEWGELGPWGEPPRLAQGKDPHPVEANFVVGGGVVVVVFKHPVS